jgi:hypothetical protein
MFKAANWNNPDNPRFQTVGNALCRFEFYELLVRIAFLKYYETGICKTNAEAFKKLIDDHLIANFEPIPQQFFRDGAKNPDKLWANPPNDILEFNL